MDSASVQVVVGIIQAVSSIVLTVLTLLYVFLTKRISDASSQTVKQFMQQQRPAIVVRLGHVVMARIPHAIELDAVNVGMGPAVNFSANYVARGAAMAVTSGASSSFLPSSVNDGSSMKIKLEGSQSSSLPDKVSGTEFVLGVAEFSYSDIHGGRYSSKFELFIDADHNVRDRVVG